MNHIPTVSLKEAVGHTLQAAALEGQHAVLLWTDQTVSLLYAEAGYDGDAPDMEEDDAARLEHVISDETLTALGLLTREERLQRVLDAKAKADASRLSAEQREYARLKQKFEQQAQPGYDLRAILQEYDAAKTDFDAHRGEDDGWSARRDRVVAMEQLLVHIAREEAQP
jgi:uncharacterized GH25 family protein